MIPLTQQLQRGASYRDPLHLDRCNFISTRLLFALTIDDEHHDGSRVDLYGEAWALQLLDMALFLSMNLETMLCLALD